LYIGYVRDLGPTLHVVNFFALCAGVNLFCGLFIANTKRKHDLHVLEVNGRCEGVGFCMIVGELAVGEGSRTKMILKINKGAKRGSGPRPPRDSTVVCRHKIPEVVGTIPDRVQLVLPIHVQYAFSKRV
jgi:hypothetical protein